MRMVITTGPLEEGAHHVSEELYKKVMVLLMSETHPELSRPTQLAADGAEDRTEKIWKSIEDDPLEDGYR